MESGQALEPVEQDTIEFRGDEIVAIQMADGRIAVVLRWICESLRLNAHAQVQRIGRTTSIADELLRVKVQTAGGKQTMPALTLRGFPIWILGINPKEVKEDPEHPEEAERIRAMIIAYQVEAVDVLYRHFAQKSQLSQPTTPSLLALEQIRAMGLAIVQMAEQQIEMEQKLTARLDRAAAVVGDIQRRLGAVERKLTPVSHITDEQAEEISAVVKALAELMTSKDPSKNHYQGIFGELYRRCGVGSYKNIRIDQYGQVLQFLEDWRRSVIESEAKHD